jgi:uncharacterized protein YbaR (Trm112 family)
MKPDDPTDDPAGDAPGADEPGPDQAGPDETGPGETGGARHGGRTVDRKLLEILVCPLTKTTLEYDAKRQELVSRAAKLAFPIRDGIPILLEEEARQLTDDDDRR